MQVVDGDAGGPGGSGAAGHYVTKTGYSLTSNVNDTLEVAVGGGGAGGGSGGGAPGGTNGKGKTDFSGGEGGNAGPRSIFRSRRRSRRSHDIIHRRYRSCDGRWRRIRCRSR